MPTFRYKARDKYGALFMGTFETNGKEAVAGHLDSLGYIPVLIEEERPGISLTDFLPQFERISSEDLIIFSRQLATLIGAGIPFMASFTALEEQTENPKLKKVINQVRRDVEGGSTFADALAKHPKVFSSLYVSMIKAGETGGVLDEMLNRLALLAEHEAETRARIKAATRYPKIVVAALVVAFGILITFVIPKFAALFANFKVELPLPTRIMIGINQVARQYGLLILVVVAAAIIGFRKHVNSVSGRLWWDGVKLKIPIFGPIFMKVALSRFARVFGTLHRAGLPILQTLEIVSETVGNVVIARIINNVRDSARQGRGIVQPMRVSKVFPPIVLQMVAVGEESGKTEEMMMKVSEYYDRDVDYAIKNLSSSLEPLLLVIISGAVLLLALAIFLPWWNLINVAKGGDKSTQFARPIRGEEGKGILDTLLVCILVGVVIGVIFPYYHRTVQEAKEVALQGGLVNIRKTIQLYHFVEHQYPPTLENLIRKRVMLPAREDTFFTEQYLSAVTADPEGHLLDPFGNRYRYDPRNGKVSSGTPGYETW